MSVQRLLYPVILRAQDYDGGYKCQVRFDAGSKLDIVPGSQVVDL